MSILNAKIFINCPINYNYFDYSHFFKIVLNLKRLKYFSLVKQLSQNGSCCAFDSISNCFHLHFGISQECYKRKFQLLIVLNIAKLNTHFYKQNRLKFSFTRFFFQEHFCSKYKTQISIRNVRLRAVRLRSLEFLEKKDKIPRNSFVFST